MLKFILICLVIANALMFAMWQGYITNPWIEPHQPQRLLGQRYSDQLTLITAEQATRPVVLPKSIEPPKPVLTPCLEWSPFAKKELKQVEARLASMSFGSRQIREQLSEATSFIVYIPPLDSKEAAEKKALELKHLGVDDYYIIKEQTNLHWGISLGVFKSEEAAKQFLEKLVAKGVHSAKISGRSSLVNKFSYQFKNITAEEKSSLENLKADFPTQTLQTCKTSN